MNSADLRPFWMLWAPSGRAPTRKHYTEAEAYREAERLVGLGVHPLFVLRSESRISPPRRIVVQPMGCGTGAKQDFDDDFPF